MDESFGTAKVGESIVYPHDTHASGRKHNASGLFYILVIYILVM